MAMERQKVKVYIANQTPLNDYMDIIQRHFEHDPDVEICALATAIPKAIHVSEILLEYGMAVKRRVLTSAVVASVNAVGSIIYRAKIDILMRKNNGGNQMNVPVPLPVYSLCVPIRNYMSVIDSLNVMHLNSPTDIQLSALGMAIPIAIKIAEILEKTRLAAKTEVSTNNFCFTDDKTGCRLHKAKIQIGLQRTAH